MKIYFSNSTELIASSKATFWKKTEERFLALERRGEPMNRQERFQHPAVFNSRNRLSDMGHSQIMFWSKMPCSGNN